MTKASGIRQHEKYLQPSKFFPKFARSCVRGTGHPAAFGLAAGAVIIWAILGPIFHFNNNWQLVINTVSNIVTLLVVFLIQNSQNRDPEPIQLKLAELIRTSHSAHNAFLDIEELSDEELERIKNDLGRLAREAREELRNRNDREECCDVQFGGDRNAPPSKYLFGDKPVLSASI
jgi:low affinity Fe/Cu permease